MPRRRSAGTLKDVCLTNIAKNMDNLWAKDYSTNFAEEGDFIYVIGPFEYLPTVLIQAIIDKLSDLKIMRRHFLHLLIHSRLDRLNLSGCVGAANLEKIIRMVGTRCTKLTHLDISMISKPSVQSLENMIRNMANLVSLSLTYTKANDQVCYVIGDTCHKLKELVLSSCAVTDRGLLSLCEGSGIRCPELIRLDLSGTYVTRVGIISALKNLKNLQWLNLKQIDYLSMMQTLQDLHKHYVPGSDVEPPPYKLKNIHYEDTWEHHKGFKVISVFCPELQNFDLLGAASNEDFIEMTKLSKLSELMLVPCHHMSLTFTDGILPLLQISGQNFKKLEFCDVNDIEFASIGICCPNLEDFTYIAISAPKKKVSYSQPKIPRGKENQVFSKLKTLKIFLHSTESRAVEPASLLLMLRNCRDLRNLHLCQVQTLTDELLAEVFNHNTFKLTKKISFEQCDQITGAIIAQLLTFESDLQYLELKNCQQITRMDWMSYLELIEKLKLWIWIEWI